jgi:hypothetical protein
VLIYRGSMDRGRTQTFLVGVAESRERRLERDFKKLCQDTNPYAGG